jgi:hypothetical protein
MLSFAAEPPSLDLCPEAGAFGLPLATCDGSGSPRCVGIGNVDAVIHPALIAEQHSRLVAAAKLRETRQPLVDGDRRGMPVAARRGGSDRTYQYGRYFGRADHPVLKAS